jgi:hypothetical protein
MERPYSERVGCVSLVGHEAQSSLIWRVVSHRRTQDGSSAIYAKSTVRRMCLLSGSGDVRFVGKRSASDSVSRAEVERVPARW